MIVQYHNLAIVKPQQDSVAELMLSITVAAARVTKFIGLKIRAIAVENKATAVIAISTKVEATARPKVELVDLVRSELGANMFNTRAQGAKMIDKAKLRTALIKKPKVLNARYKGFSIGRIAQVATSSIERSGLK